MAFEDGDLVARVVANDDRNAFAELVRRHQSHVRLLLRRLGRGDEALADDWAQETFIRIYRGLRAWRGDSKLSSWIYRVAYNVFASHHEKNERRATDPVAELPESAELHSDGGGPMLTRDVERALGQLPVAERAAVVLTCVHGATNEEAAEILECPVGTVKTHVHRARKRLREVLEP